MTAARSVLFEEFLEDLECLRQDAERYRKIRKIAVSYGELGSKVTLSQLDSIHYDSFFDAEIDAWIVN